jgi:hypothetical protein
MSAIFSELAQFIGSKTTSTTAYRPTGNSENERSHKELHVYIAMYLTPATRTSWDSLLNQASWVHNSSVHESLGCSPFELVTGLAPRVARGLLPEESSPEMPEYREQVETYFSMKKEELDKLRENAQKAIAKAQAVTLERLNKHAKVPSYSIGDLVLIRRHAYSTYVDRKWSEKFKGPYKVVEKISPVVYRVSLVEQPDYTDLVHASYMRKWKQRVPAVSTGTEAVVSEPEETVRWETFGGTPVPDEQPIQQPVQQGEAENEEVGSEKDEDFFEPTYEPPSPVTPRPLSLMERMKGVLSDATKAVRRTLVPDSASSEEDDRQDADKLNTPVPVTPPSTSVPVRRPRRKEYELLDPVEVLDRRNRGAKREALEKLGKLVPSNQKPRK